MENVKQVILVTYYAKSFISEAVVLGGEEVIVLLEIGFPIFNSCGSEGMLSKATKLLHISFQFFFFPSFINGILEYFKFYFIFFFYVHKLGHISFAINNGLKCY